MAEPTWTTPSDQYLQRVSAFNEVLTPMGCLTTLLIRYLQMHFSNSSYIQNPGLRTIVWTPDQKVSKIFIGDGLSDNVAVASQKPALYISRDDAKPLEAYIDADVLTVSINGNNPPPTVYRRIINGTHLIRCESTLAPESENLTEEVFYALLQFAPIIKQDAQLTSCGINMSKVGKLEKAGYAGSVAVMWNTFVELTNPEITVW